MSALAVGAVVLVNSPGHRKDGLTGTVTDGPGMFMGTWTVVFAGNAEHRYGFWASELTIIEGGRTTDPSTTTK